jgi:hypothetical protein
VCCQSSCALRAKGREGGLHAEIEDLVAVSVKGLDTAALVGVPEADCAVLRPRHAVLAILCDRRAGRTRRLSPGRARERSADGGEEEEGGILLKRTARMGASWPRSSVMGRDRKPISWLAHRRILMKASHMRFRKCRVASSQ